MDWACVLSVDYTILGPDLKLGVLEPRKKIDGQSIAY